MNQNYLPIPKKKITEEPLNNNLRIVEPKLHIEKNFDVPSKDLPQNKLPDGFVNNQKIIIEKDNKHETLANIINYLVTIIDFVNVIIYHALNLIYEKILGNDNNLINSAKSYFDVLIDFIVKKISDQTLNTLDKLGKMEENKGLLTMWNEYKKEINTGKRDMILRKYLEKHGINLSDEKCKNITLNELIDLLEKT